MFTVKETRTFSKWIDNLKDKVAQLRIDVRIKRLEAGNPGDVKLLSGGIYEMRIDYARGYRIYYIIRNREIIILLAGGDKTSQNKDIKTAQRLAREYREIDND